MKKVWTRLGFFTVGLLLGAFIYANNPGIIFGFVSGVLVGLLASIIPE